MNTHCPSLKYSFSVLLNLLLYFTNSLLRCSKACLPADPGMKPATSLTASNSFFIALAISLRSFKCVVRYDWEARPLSTHFIVSRKVLRSVISSGILLSIFFNDADFLFSSWNASSDLAKRYSTTETQSHRFGGIILSRVKGRTIFSNRESYYLSVYHRRPRPCPAAAGYSRSCLDSDRHDGLFPERDRALFQDESSPPWRERL